MGRNNHCLIFARQPVITFNKAYIWISLFVIFILGCTSTPASKIAGTQSQPTQTMVTPSSEVSTPSIHTPILVLSPTAKPTQIPTAAPTITISPSPTQIATATATAGPILSAEEQYAYWQAVVQSNRNCSLPCFLGIAPGESGWEDVAALYAPVTNGQFKKPRPFENTNLYELYDICITNCDEHNLHFSLYEDEGIIKTILIWTENINRRPEVGQAMQSYRLDLILKKYGEPSRISLNIKPFPFERGAPPVYSLDVFYDEQGILLIYYGSDVAILDSEMTTAQVCPIFENVYYFQLLLRSKDDARTLEQVATDAGITRFKRKYNSTDRYLPRPLEAVTNLSVPDFYRIFQTPGACFTSSVKIWE